MVEKKIKIRVDSGDANNSINEVNDSIKGANSAVGGLTSSLDKMTGGAISAFNGIKSGVKSGIAAMKSLKVAIAATGIGLLVVAVGALTAAFRGSEEGQNKLARIMSVIGAITGNLVDLLADLGDGIIKAFENPMESLRSFGNMLQKNLMNRFTGMLELIPNVGKAVSLLFKGRFKEAGRTALDAVSKVALGFDNMTDKIKNAIDATGEFIKQNVEEGKAAAKVADMRAKADKIERDLVVERSKLESEIAALRLKSRQEEEFSAEERKQALLDAQALQDSLLEKETEYLQLRADAQSMENTFARSNKENLDAEAQAIAAVNRVNADRLNQQRSTQRELNRVNKEIERDKKAAQKEQEAADKEATKAAEEAAKARLDAEQKILEATLNAQDLEVLKAQQKYNALIEEAQKYGLDETALVEAKAQAINTINAKYDKQDSDRKKKKAADDLAVQEATLGAISGTLGSLSELAGKDAATGKALSAAQAVINTYTGATKALAQGGIAGPIAAAGVIASGIASIRQIYATQLPATSGGSGSVSAPRPSIQAPQISPRLALNTQVSDLGNQITQSLQGQPMRAYVVNQDIQNAGKMDRKIEQTATFG